MGKAIRQGILWTFVGIFPATVVVGLLFRFPVPFRGYVSGWSAFQEGYRALAYLPWLLCQAAFFYAIWGGFVPIVLLGVVAGQLGWRLGGTGNANRYTRYIALGFAFVAAIVLSVLDKVVGPW